MGLIKDGTFNARALNGSHGPDEKDFMTCRVEFEIVSGPDAGQRITYNGRVDARSAPYVAKDLKAVGWKGKTLASIGSDVESAKAVVPIEIQHKQTKDGMRTFAVVRSIGRGAKPLRNATNGQLKEADELLLAAHDEAPHAADANEQDIPF